MPAARTAAKKPAKKASKPVKTSKKTTIDDVWAIMERLEKNQEEIQKAHKETKKIQDEVWKVIRETQEAQKETQRHISGLGHTVGALVERIMTAGLPQKFKPFGFTFDKVTTVKWASGKTVYAEIDGLLENGDQAMVVEVKSKLEHRDIADHIERMERVRAYADDHGDKRKFYGAIASTVASEKNREYALEQGFYFIEPLGEDVKISPPAGKPKVW